MRISDLIKAKNTNLGTFSSLIELQNTYSAITHKGETAYVDSVRYTSNGVDWNIALEGGTTSSTDYIKSLVVERVSDPHLAGDILVGGVSTLTPTEAQYVEDGIIQPSTGPIMTSANGVLTRIDYQNGDYKTFEYTNGSLSTMVYHRGPQVVTKVFNYDGSGALTSVTESVA